MRLRCGTFYALVATILTATAADVQPISVRVRQTAGGPRLFVDGKPIPPRAFYGAGPSIGFIAEVREYTFTLPFTAPVSTERAEIRIAFPSVPSKFWIHDVTLVDGEACSGPGQRKETPWASRWRERCRTGVRIRIASRVPVRYRLSRDEDTVCASRSGLTTGAPSSIPLSWRSTRRARGAGVRSPTARHWPRRRALRQRLA